MTSPRLLDRWSASVGIAALAFGGLFLATVLVVLLGVKLRSVRADYATLRSESRFVPLGSHVPRLELALASGRAAVVGEPSNGHRQVLFIYTTTCQFCAANLPAWQDITDRVHSRGGTAYGLTPDSAETVRAFELEHALTFPTALLTTPRSVGLFHATIVPQTLVIATDGRVLYTRPGVLTEPAVDTLVAVATVWSGRDGEARYIRSPTRRNNVGFCNP